MKLHESVTLRDIAEQAGVSKMTVSKALRDAPGVSEKNRERIKKIAKKLGYIPNPKVSIAMSAIAHANSIHQGEKLAFLTTHSSESGWKKIPHIVECFEGAEERARGFGYELEPFWAFKPKVNLSDVLYARGIDGILVAPTGTELMREGRRTIDFDWSRLSVVELDEQLDEPTFRVVRHDHFASMLTVLYHLEKLGYRRIGLAMSRRAEYRNRHRWSSAYLLWSNVRKLENPIPVYLHEGYAPEDLAGWVKKNKLDAVVGLPGEYRQLMESGFRFPDELGFALLDWQKVSSDSTSCTGMDQQSQALGARAIDLLVGLIRTGKKGPPTDAVQMVCRGQWIDGDTTRKVREPSGDLSLYDIALPL